MPTAARSSRRTSTALPKSSRRYAREEWRSLSVCPSPLLWHTRLSGAPQFDGVAYSFGGSLLYFLQDYLERVSPGSYFGALHNYIVDYSYGNAEVRAGGG